MKLLKPFLVLAAILILSGIVSAAECPEECQCLSKEEAEKLNCEVCDKEISCGEDKYCYKCPTCPAECVCLTEERAKEKGYEKLCNNERTVCGYEDNIEKYCWQKPEVTPTPATCPDGCVCLTKEDAERKGYTRLCSDEICGYDSSQNPMYCWKEVEVTPTPELTLTPTTTYTCPAECVCLTEEKAREKFSCPARCSDKICGYEVSTATSLSAAQTPKYCYKESCTSTACPTECICLTEEKAKEKGYDVRCSDKICGYEDNVPEYCFKGEVSKCPEDCICLGSEEVKKYEEEGIKFERCTDKPCDEDGKKYCYKKVEWECPNTCTCLSKEEGYKEGLEFCKDSAGNLVRCGVISAEHGEYKYCFKKPVEKCQFDRYSQTCAGYCPDNTRCTMTSDYEVCIEKCKKRLEECADSREECKKEYEKCIDSCVPSCSCTGYECPAGCRCLDDREVEKYREEGLKIERCSDKECEDGKYCYKVVKECYYDYEKNVCVGECPNGEKCNLNAVKRDPNTGKVIYAECSCKPLGICSNDCVCLTREDASKKFRNPVLCSQQPCGRELTSTSAASNEVYLVKYCFREGQIENCYFDKERNACVGKCEKGECKMYRDAYGNPYCRCVSEVKPVSDAYVERILPKTAQPLSCIPVKLKINPKEGTTGLILTETFPADFEYKGATVEPDKIDNNTLKWLLMDINGLEEQEIEYKLCLPRDAIGDYYFRGLWETETTAGAIMGDDVLSVVPTISNWPPCPVTDQMLLGYISQWSNGELSDLQLLQAIEVWANGC